MEDELEIAGYVDKTAHIREIFKDGLLISLITRPPRFGKTSMLQTLRAFLELDYENPGATARHESLFKGRAVLEDVDFCRENMGRWPVIFLSFASVENMTFCEALNRIALEIRREWTRHRFLLKSERVSPELREMAGDLCDFPACSDGPSAEQLIVALQSSLRTLELALFQHFGFQSVLLIDDYDTPLANASLWGFYKNMEDVIRRLLNAGDGPELRKAVLMGRLCLPPGGGITGFNNFVPHPASEGAFPEAFGFTEAETQRVLSANGFFGHKEAVKERCGGYLAGGAELYSPWDVQEFCRKARAGYALDAQRIWAGPDGCHRLYDFLDRAGEAQLEMLAALLRGETVPAEIDEVISYAELDSKPTPGQLFSALYADGYFTSAGRAPDGKLRIRIPNSAVRACIWNCIDWHFGIRGTTFCASAKALAEALAAGDIKQIRVAIGSVLPACAIFGDESDESFYSGLLAKLFSVSVSEGVRGRYFSLASNSETGDGSENCFLCAEGQAAVAVRDARAVSASRGDRERE